MVERIVPATEALAERERKAIEDMRALFPDGNVSGLDTKDKSLGKRLSKLYVALGYESRSDMIEALGFRQERTNMGGRPTTLDPEAIFAELADRYDGLPKPKAVGLLLNENPDLKGNIKSLQNKSNELFGRSLAKELIARGLLDKPSSDKPDISDEEILEAVDKLEEKYASADKKAKTLTALKKLEPEYVDVIDALDSKRSRALLGTTAADYFKSHGILEGGGLYTDDADVEAAVAALADLSKEIPDDDKPKTIADVCARYPEYAALIKAGQQKKVLTKNTLMERGIIGLTQAAKKAKQKLERERCVRNAEVPELLRMYCGSGGQMLVVPGQDSGFLRPGVIGLDVAAGYELRETTMLSARSVDVKPGDELDVRYGMSGNWALPHGIELSKGNTQIANVPRPDCDAFVACQPFDVDTDLAQYVSNVVENVEQAGDKSFVRIRHRFLSPISSETMIFALRGIGAISDEELLGGDAWRDRLDAMPEDLGVIAPKRPAAANEQKSSPVMDEKPDADSPVPTSSMPMKTEERTEHVKYELSEKTPPASQSTENGGQEETVEPLDETPITESAPAIAFGASAKNASEGNASEAAAPSGFGFSISGKSMSSTPASNHDDQAGREEAERIAKEKAEQERLEAEERERREAEERARKEAEEKAERERIEAEERARREAEEKARKEAEEKARKEAEEKAERERREAEERAERERKEAGAKRAEAQEEIDKAKAKLDGLRREQAEFAARAKEIGQLESKVKSLESEIANLGIFKGKEKKTKRAELAQVMSEIASLKEKNVGASSKESEIAEVEKQLEKATAKLKSLG